MSNFQYQSFSDDFDNPFGDPRQVTQPPVIQPTPAKLPDPTTTSTARIETQVLDDFNPFEKHTSGGGATAPAVLPASDAFQPPPSYTLSPAVSTNNDELERRQREIEARELELSRREEEIRKQSVRAGAQENNWPPLPQGFPWGPCFYQDINVEIPSEYQRIVRLAYYLWLGHAVVLLFNIIAAIAYMVGTTASSESGSTFGLSLIFAVIFIPLSYVCWFRPLYKAFRSDSSFYFFFFFFVFAAQILILILQGLGINWFAGCGWINGIVTTANSAGAGAVMLISAVAFTALVIGDVLLIMRVHRIYRGTGASFEKAKVEFAQGVYSNSTVRAAAMEAGTSVVRGGMTESGVRY